MPWFVWRHGRPLARMTRLGCVAVLGLPCLMAGHPAAADPVGTITEFRLTWPDGIEHSTHELGFEPRPGGGIWVTGQNMNYLAHVTLDGTAHYVPMPDGSGPHGMDFDGQGRLWVSLEFAGEVVRLDEAGHIIQKIDVAMRPPGAPQPINPSPHAITFGPDGRTIWFTGKATGTVGRIDPDGSVAHFALKTVGAVPIYLEVGPDRNIWGTELVGNQILRVRPDGTVTEFPIPTANSRPIAIVPGPDGQSMWFSEEAGDNVARIDMAGHITEYLVPHSGDNVILAGLAFDRDGNLWTQMYASQPNRYDDRDYVVRIDKAIQQAPPGDLSKVPITYYRTPSRNTVMHRIKQGPDGNMWFTELNTDRLGRLTTGEPPAK